MAGLMRRRFCCVFAVMAVVMTAGCGPEGSTAGGTAAGSTMEAGAAAEDAAKDEGEPVAGAEGEIKDDGSGAGEEKGPQTPIPISVNNDTVEMGTLAVFEPSDHIGRNSGVAIAGSDEEQLQQERIAGGAVGEVVSENLEPLYGITDYSEGEYVAVYGVTAE